MNKLLRVLIVLSLGLIIVGCNTTQPATSPPPAPPAVPADVISVWNSPPSPRGLPPIVSEDIVLTRYGEPYSSHEVDSFFLPNYEWIDVVVKSKNMLVFFSDKEPGTVSFSVDFVYDDSSFGPDAEDVGYYPGGQASPFVGKLLYVNEETRTSDGVVYSTAVRLFAEGGRTGNAWVGSDCYLSFYNYDPYKQAEVSYEVYELDTTPEWGMLLEGDYYNAILIPWLEGAPSESEAGAMWNQWLEQAHQALP